jgi:signal transduction histidine kinase/ABC-type amino acid transport substrate-binding protein
MEKGCWRTYLDCLKSLFSVWGRKSGLAFGIFCCAFCFSFPLLATQQDTSSPYNQNQESPRIIYGGDRNYPPFEFINEEGEPDGFHIDLLRAIARQRGWQVEFRLDDWVTIYESFTEDTVIDVADMFYNPGRRDEALFSDPLTIVYHEMVVRRGDPAMSMDSLEGKTVIVEAGTMLEDYLRENFQSIDIITVASEPAALKLLANEKFDVALVSHYTFQLMKAQGQIDNLVRAGSPMLPRELSFAVHAKDSALLKEINQGIRSLKASGEFTKIYNKWFAVPNPQGLTLKESLKILFFTILALFIASVVAIVWIRSLRKAVAQKTQALQQELEDRKLANLQLKESQAMLKEAQLLARMGSWSFDPVTNELDWQDDIAGLRCFEVDATQSLRPYAYLSAIHPDDQVKFVEVFENAKKGRVYKSFQFRALNQQKEIMHLSMSTHPLYDEDERLVKVVGIIQDVTDRIVTEKELRFKNEELEKTNEELDRFVYSLSHDIKAPIASVSGLVTLMKLDVEDPKAKMYIPKIEDSIDKLQHFISDILNYSRNVRLEVQASKIDLEHLIRSTYELLHYIAGAEKIDFDLQVEQHEEFFSDPYRLRVIFNNILSNAIKYIDENKLRSYIKVRVFVDSEAAVMRFQDNGVGIGQQHLDKLFNMFYRATEASTGAGLGLYIVKEVIDKLHGSISLNSVPGEGTNIEIRIPNMKAREEALRSAA